LDASERAQLHAAIVGVLTEWRDRLAAEQGDRFPEKVTAFRPRHGRARSLSPALPRLRRAGPARGLRRNEMNYCARCQTNGRLLADRALSRLLRDDWPKTLEELEERRRG
jgi:formamidopyrimidine-DNA glycosylase